MCSRPDTPRILGLEAERQRDLREIGDPEQFGVGRDRLAKYDRSRDHLTGDWRDDAKAVQTAAAVAGRRHLALRLGKCDPCFGCRCSRGDQILLGRDTLGEQPLLARQVGVGQSKPSTRRLDLTFELRSLAALNDREGLAPRNTFAKIAVERDHAPGNPRRDNLRGLRITVDRRRQFDRSGAANQRRSDLHASGRYLIGRQRDDAFIGMADFLGLLRCGFIRRSAHAAGSKHERERHCARQLNILHHWFPP